MNSILRRTSGLQAVDILIIAFAFLLSIIILIAAGGGTPSSSLIATNAVASCSVIGLAYRAAKTGNRALRAIHDWYPVPVIFLVFKEIHEIIHLFGSRDWDSIFIEIDRATFTVDPTVWLGRFAHPFVTETLQIAYASYYFIMLTVAVELFVRKDKHEFSFVLFTIVYGFFLSYLGYITFPAVGPRFTIHTFTTLSTDLPGVMFTDWIRDVLNAGESIPRDGVNAFVLAQRDAFPSGHTQMTLISLYLAFHYHLKSTWMLTIFGTLLIIGTVYLRYHYVIDLVGGALFMMFTVWTAPKLFVWWEGDQMGDGR